MLLRSAAFILLALAGFFAQPLQASEPAGCGGDAACLVDHAIDLLRESKGFDRKESAPTIVCAATVEAALGRLGIANSLLSEGEALKKNPGPGFAILGPMLRARALGRLAVASSVENPSEANRLSKDAIQSLGDLSLPQPFADDVLNDIAGDIVILGRVTDAVALVKSPIGGTAPDLLFRDAPYSVASGLGHLAGISYQLGRATEGDRLIAEAKDQAARVSDETRHGLAFKAIALGLFDGGHVDESLQAVRMIQPTGRGPIGMAMDAGTVRLIAYRHIAGLEVARGDYTTAWSVIKGADLEFPIWDPLRYIILEIAAKGFPGDTRDLFNQIEAWVAKIPPEKVDVLFLAATGSVYLQAGDRDRGLAYLNRVIETAQQMRRNADPRKNQYDLHDFYITAAAKGFAEAGDFGRAMQLVDSEIVNPNTKRNIARWGTLKEITLIALKRGHIDEAQRILNSENDPELGDSVLHEWANIDADAGRYADAESRSDQIQSVEERTQSYVDVAARSAFGRSKISQHIIIFRDEFMRNSLHTELYP